MKREEVYKLIDGEREYQDKKWAPEGRPMSDDKTPIAAWLIYIGHHLSCAEFEIYVLKEQNALEHIRKIAGLCVACMEFNETPPRKETK